MALWAVRKAGLADFSVVAVCDADAERAASLGEHHAASLLALDDLIAECDAIYVCTPTAQHLPLVEAIADAGKALFCEKPLAPSLDDATRVAEALASVPHQVGLVLRCSPVFNVLRNELASGRHGRPMSIAMRDDQYFPIRGQYGSEWRSQHAVAGGGTLIEHSIHDLDLFRFLVGDPIDVTCRTASFFGHERIDDLALATFSYADGLIAQLTSIWHEVMTRPSTRRLEVFCEHAHLWTEDDNCGPLHIETSSGHEVRDCPPPTWVDEIPVPTERRRPLGLYAEQSRRFLAAASTGTTGSVGAFDALAAHRLVDAAYRSAASGGVPISV
jgi:predicted dehydrogenase